MRIGYLECFAGISGDMLMAALVDAGASIDLLQRTAASLGLGAELQVTRVSRSGIQSTKIDVMVDGRLHEPVQPSGPIEHEHSHQHDHEHEHSTHTMSTAISMTMTTRTSMVAACRRFATSSCMPT